MKYLLAALIALALPAQAVEIPASSRASVVKVTYARGFNCSGVALSVKAVMAATHCEKSGGQPVAFNEKHIAILETLSDRNDHTIYLLAESVNAVPVRRAKRPAKPGDEVHFYGFGRDHDRLLRFGFYAGEYELPEAPRPESGIRRAHVFQFGTGGGDSGGPIFNRRGRLVALLSLGYRRDGIILAGAFPLAFTREQWRAAGVR